MGLSGGQDSAIKEWGAPLSYAYDWDDPLSHLPKKTWLMLSVGAVAFMVASAMGQA